jgi:multidrug resistance efflux pump
MKPGVRVVAVVLVLAVVAGLFWYVDGQRTKARSVLSGYFESQPTDVASRTSGRVAQILVSEGDMVRQGQTLIELEAGPDRDSVLSKVAAAEQAEQHYLDLLHGPRPQDIAQAAARLAQAEDAYDKAVAGSRPQEISEAAAAAGSAWARYAEALRGPTAEERAEAQARLAGAAAQETLARADYARYSRLYTEEAVTRQQLDEAVASVRSATANRRDLQEAWQRATEGTPRQELDEARQSYLQAEAAYDLVRAGSRPEDIAAAQAQVDEDRAALAEIEAGTRTEQTAEAKAAADAAAATARSVEGSYAERLVTAPISGVVESIPVSAGDLVTSGTPLARVDDPADIWVRVFVPEANLASVVVGGDADLRVDGVAEPVSAYVESVATSGEFTPADLQTPGDRGQQVFGVRLRLRRPDPRIKAGMYTTVTRIGNWRP